MSEAPTMTTGTATQPGCRMRAPSRSPTRSSQSERWVRCCQASTPSTAVMTAAATLSPTTWSRAAPPVGAVDAATMSYVMDRV